MPSLRIAVDKESGLILAYSSVAFCSIYIVNAVIPSQFAAIYGFNSLQIGLCYIPIGAGSLLSIMTVGRITDWNFHRHAKRLGMDITKGRQTNLDDFPIETVRMEIAVPLVVLNCVALIIFGWVLDFKQNLAAPLICMFVLGFVSVGCWEPMNTLIIDLNPSAAAASTAAGNLYVAGSVQGR
jgi:MFS family permease